MTTRTLVIDSSGPTQTAIRVDGVDISRHVRRVTVKIGPHELNTADLEVYPTVLNIEASYTRVECALCGKRHKCVGDETPQ